MDDEIDWVAIEADAHFKESRRLGVEILHTMFTMDPKEFAQWIQRVPEEQYFDTIMALLTISEFLVDSNARALNVPGEMFIKCLRDLAEE